LSLQAAFINRNNGSMEVESTTPPLLLLLPHVKEETGSIRRSKQRTRPILHCSQPAANRILGTFGEAGAAAEYSANHSAG
jgi:hypothetical protein